MGSQTISLNWSNHRKNMSSVFQHLFSTEAFVDVTLACEGLYLKAHKIILSASSQFFETLLLENPCQHPIVILTDMRYSDLTEIINFMYQGMIEIAQDRLNEFLKTAEKLKIKGLSIDSENADYDSEQDKTHSVPDLSNRQLCSDEIALQVNYNDEQVRANKSDSDSSAFYEINTKLPTSSIKLEHSATLMELSDREPLNEAKELPLRDYCAVSCSTDQENGRNEIPSSNQYTDCYSLQQGDSVQGPLFPEEDNQLFIQTLSEQSRLELEDDGRMKLYEDVTEVSKQNKYVNNDISVKDIQNGNDEDKVLQMQEPFTAKDIIHAVQSYGLPSSKGDPLHCDACGRTFESVQNLSQHICIHINDQRFSCAICNKAFLRKSYLRHHIRTHSGERPFSCNICSKAFGQRDHLRTHLRIHSGEKPFTCDVCNKKFITKNHLTIHSRSHTGERPYGCGICEKSYTKSSDLVSHVRVHTGEKPFKCNVCNKSFVQNSALKVHTMKIHYGNQ